MSETPVKQCSRCGNIYPATTVFFAPDKAYKYGVTSRCRECIRQYQIEYRLAYPDKDRQKKQRYRERNAEKIREQNRKREERDRTKRRAQRRVRYAVRKDELNGKQSARRRISPEHYRARDKKYRQKDREKSLERTRKWRRTNPAKARMHNHKWRALRAQSGGTHTAADIDRIYQAQKGRCYWCDALVGNTYHVDHVIPVTRGGSDGPENLVISCPTCNRSKSNKLPHEWAGNNGKLL